MTTQSSLFWNMDGEDVAHFHCADIRTPSALASAERAMQQPSLFDSTTSGLPRSSGWNTRSHEA